MNKRKKNTSTTELYAGGPTFPSDLRAAVLGRVPLNTSHIRQPSPHMSEALEINQTKLAVVKERERKKERKKKELKHLTSKAQDSDSRDSNF